MKRIVAAVSLITWLCVAWSAAGADKPLIFIQHFEFYSGLRGLFLKPMHVGTVNVKGLVVNIPPREERQAAAEEKKPLRGKIKIFVDEIVCDDSRLVLGTLKPGGCRKTLRFGTSRCTTLGRTCRGSMTRRW